MPELVEVELSCRSLQRWCEGRSLIELEILDPRVLKAGDPALLEGQRVRWVRRRGKLGLIGLQTHVIVFHLRMTGQWIAQDSKRPRSRVRARLRMESLVLDLDDARCLGHLEVLALQELESKLESLGLGPEPWPEPRDGDWWRQQFLGLRGPIKTALMNQGRVAGLGNIAGSESCYRARIDPRRPVPTLSAIEWSSLAVGVNSYIECTLELEEGQELVYLTQGGLNPFLIYGRVRCPGCSGPVRRLRLSGRSTWLCSTCQI